MICGRRTGKNRIRDAPLLAAKREWNVTRNDQHWEGTNRDPGPKAKFEGRDRLGPPVVDGVVPESAFSLESQDFFLEMPCPHAQLHEGLAGISVLAGLMTRFRNGMGRLEWRQ